MASGTSNSMNTSTPTTASTVVVGVLGMLVLAGTGIAVIAAAALLPAYASLKDDQYQRDCQAVETEHLRRLTEANANFVAGVENDPLLRERIAIEQGGHVPLNGTPIDSAVASRPDHIYVTAPPMPTPATGRLLQIAQRISRPGTRRGLYLMGACLILVGVLLGGPAEDDRPLAEA
jgi:hypothetical protein